MTFELKIHASICSITCSLRMGTITSLDQKAGPRF